METLHIQQQTIAIDAMDRRTQFRELLDRHRGIVFKVAASYCSETHDRADLAQEIAAQAWRAFPNCDSARPFSTWLYRIALNVAISSLRASRERVARSVPFDAELHDSAGSDADEPEQAERLRLLRRCIDAFDPLNRALLLLYLDERSHADIAEILGLSETNVATKIGRLKQRLRDQLAGN
jgi:RNA polymerase sigma factor (sigma-70 family)